MDTQISLCSGTLCTQLSHKPELCVWSRPSPSAPGNSQGFTVHTQPSSLCSSGLLAGCSGHFCQCLFPTSKWPFRLSASLAPSMTKVTTTRLVTVVVNSTNIALQKPWELDCIISSLPLCHAQPLLDELNRKQRISLPARCNPFEKLC